MLRHDLALDVRHDDLHDVFDVCEAAVVKIVVQQ